MKRIRVSTHGEGARAPYPEGRVAARDGGGSWCWCRHVVCALWSSGLLVAMPRCLGRRRKGQKRGVRVGGRGLELEDRTGGHGRYGRVVKGGMDWVWMSGIDGRVGYRRGLELQQRFSAPRWRLLESQKIPKLGPPWTCQPELLEGVREVACEAAKPLGSMGLKAVIHQQLRVSIHRYQPHTVHNLPSSMHAWYHGITHAAVLIRA